MHLDSGITPASAASMLLPSPRAVARACRVSDEELEAIMLRTVGPVRRRQYRMPEVSHGGSVTLRPAKKQVMIVDGYNVIFAWEPLKALAAESLEGARETLMDILDNYVSYTQTDLTLVFDAYNVADSTAREYERNGYRVVYTAQNETGDAYIERMMHQLGPDYAVRVVTSDRLIQISAVHSGISRTSAREFEEEIRRINLEITAFIRRLDDGKA